MLPSNGEGGENMIYVVGLGPGKKDQMTKRALDTLDKCDVIIGYKAYIDLIKDYYDDKKELVSSPMKGETSRCHMALERALNGDTVAIVSSGDPGVYGMAGIMLEIAQGKTEVEIVPGMTAACTAAAILGAPLMHDFAIISLSDLLTPWELIEKRLTLAGEADFIVCLYNPASHGRPDHLRKAVEILLQSKSPETPAGWVKNAGRDGEEYGVTTLDKIADEPINMFTTVIIGNSTTKIQNGKMLTPRGYKI